MDKIMIAPSTDPAKTVEEIVKYINEIKDFADLLHCDIMDGLFVENKTYSYDVLKIIKEKTLLPLDVHLMVKNPTKVIKNFIKNGANILTVHFESYKNKKNLIKDLKRIRKLGALSGLSIKPNTKIHEIETLLCYCDVVLIMSVEPGKSGQEFIENTYIKVNELNNIKEHYNIRLKIEVDGGVKPIVSKRLIDLGANILVSGNYIYKSENKEQAIFNLKN